MKNDHFSLKRGTVEWHNAWTALANHFRLPAGTVGDPDPDSGESWQYLGSTRHGKPWHADPRRVVPNAERANTEIVHEFRHRDFHGLGRTYRYVRASTWWTTDQLHGTAETRERQAP